MKQQLKNKIISAILAYPPETMTEAEQIADDLIRLVSAEVQREAFNAGYSYGIEAEASPEEYDAAWRLYQQSGRIQGEDAQ